MKRWFKKQGEMRCKEDHGKKDVGKIKKYKIWCKN